MSRLDRAVRRVFARSPELAPKIQQGSSIWTYNNYAKTEAAILREWRYLADLDEAAALIRKQSAENRTMGMSGAHAEIHSDGVYHFNDDGELVMIKSFYINKPNFGASRRDVPLPHIGCDP